MSNTPFLDTNGFTALWDGAPLSDAQQGQIELLLAAASDWIYARRPDIDPTDGTGKLVTYEVVANCLRFGRYGPLKEFNNTTAHRAESGTLDDPASALDFTDRHKMWLGIALRSDPISTCRPNDWDADDINAGWPTPWSVAFGSDGY